MLNSKKGLASYLVIIFLVSIVVSFFLFFILDGIYGNSHENCSTVNFEIIDICSNGQSASFTIANHDTSLIKISFDEVISTRDLIGANSKANLDYAFTEDKVSLIPYIEDKGQVYFCSGKKQVKNVRIVTKKC